MYLTQYQILHHLDPTGIYNLILYYPSFKSYHTYSPHSSHLSSLQVLGNAKIFPPQKFYNDSSMIGVSCPAGSFLSFRSQLKCYLFREAFPNLLSTVNPQTTLLQFYYHSTLFKSWRAENDLTFFFPAYLLIV